MKKKITKKVLTPQAIVAELDAHIIGQQEGKRAVAIALRNRWRRSQVDAALRAEITPKNILMIGPTGVGKTEIARRLAGLVQAPFIKVEATKFTEVGYVGRDIESIIRDLVEIAYKRTREQEVLKVEQKSQESALTKVLEIVSHNTDTPREVLRDKILNGDLDDTVIEIEMAAASIGVEILAPPGMEEMTSQLQHLFSNLSSDRVKKRKMKIKNALQQLANQEAAALINEEEIRGIAVTSVEQQGIVFIDEIDKITSRGNSHGADISREGVQRDLLPLVEGTTVFTKYGMVKTNHILFIASGAFHLSKPSDLIPELQGRFPIRVELHALSTQDFVRILVEPKASLVEQYEALLATEKVTIKFTQDCIETIAQIAFQVNERTENIGARRLYTIMERLLEEISFSAPGLKGKTITLDADYVNKQLVTLVANEDLTRYIL